MHEMTGYTSVKNLKFPGDQKFIEFLACKKSSVFYGCKSLKKSPIFLCREKCFAFFSGLDLQTPIKIKVREKCVACENQEFSRCQNFQF